MTQDAETMALDLRAQAPEERELRAREVVRAVLPVLRGQALRERSREANRDALRDLDEAIKRCEAVLFGPARSTREVS